MKAGDVVGGKYVLNEHLMTLYNPDFGRDHSYWIAKDKYSKNEFVLISAKVDWRKDSQFEYDEKNKLDFEVNPRQPRDILQRYELIRILGEGTSKLVWNALDTFKKRRCAFLIYKRKDKGKKVLTELRKEYLNLCNIRHPNVVQVYDMGMYDDSRPFVTEELLVGKDLKTIADTFISISSLRTNFEKLRLQLPDILKYACIKNNSTLKNLAEKVSKQTQYDFCVTRCKDLKKLDKEIRKEGAFDTIGTSLDFSIHEFNGDLEFVQSDIKLAVDLLCPIASGLSHLHKSKIIHRDIRLQNIVIKETRFTPRTPVIIDFGLSVGPEPFYSKTKGVLYRAPEVILKEHYSSQSDVWAFGIVAYYLLTNSFLFGSKKENLSNLSKEELVLLENEISGRVVSELPVSVRNLNPGVSAKLEEIVMTCLEKDMGKRYKCASQIFSQLKNVE